MAPDSPEKAPPTRTVQELIQDEIAQLDKNPALSSEEQAVARRTLEGLTARYGAKVLETRIETMAQLTALQQELGEQRERFQQERNPGRTDIFDLSSTFAGTIRRLQIERTINGFAGGVETVSDLRKLPVDTLIRLEDAHEGILLYAFTDAVSDETSIDLQHFYWNPKERTKLRVDFRDNIEAEEKIGAADLFPPSVRAITVYEKGNTNLARTSTRRVGLKGRNVYGTGFFDSQGYIPIFTGDVVVLGGVDAAFEKKYRRADRSLDYGAYERDHGIQEKEFVTDLERRGLHTKKDYTPEELAALERDIQASGIRQRVVNAAMDLLRTYSPGKHCWDWVEQAYRNARAKRRTVYRHTNYIRRAVRGDSTFNDNPENPPVVASIESGDWVFVHNRNGSDRRGDHSILFLRWLDKGNLIGQAVSCPRGGCSGRIHRVDFKRTPATLIMKPVAVG